LDKRLLRAQKHGKVIFKAFKNKNKNMSGSFGE
jgi:hypothetical protein